MIGLDDVRYLAVCEVIDRAKNDDDAGDTDDYATEIVAIMAGGLDAVRAIVDTD